MGIAAKRILEREGSMNTVLAAAQQHHFWTSATFPIIIAVIAIIAVLAILASGYVKAPPDQAYIISGLKRKARSLLDVPALRFHF